MNLRLDWGQFWMDSGELGRIWMIWGGIEVNWVKSNFLDAQVELDEIIELEDDQHSVSQLLTPAQGIS